MFAGTIARASFLAEIIVQAIVEQTEILPIEGLEKAIGPIGELRVQRSIAIFLSSRRVRIVSIPLAGVQAETGDQ